MMKTRFIVAAALVIMAVLGGCVTQEPARYEAQITLLAEEAYYTDIDEAMNANAHGIVTEFDLDWNIAGTEITYGGEVVYSGAASYIGTFPDSVYVYSEGTLTLVHENEVSEALAVPEDLVCITVSETDGIMRAYFADAKTRDFYAYNLADGSFAVGNVGEAPILRNPEMPYFMCNVYVTRVGDYICIRRYADVETEEEFATFLKQEGGELTEFTPDFSNVQNSNPSGGKLLLFYKDELYGYMDAAGAVRAMYDDASAFYYDENGNGVAFVTADGESYFVDQYLNRISAAYTNVEGAFCSAEGIIELKYPGEVFHSYKAEFVYESAFSMEDIARANSLDSVFAEYRSVRTERIEFNTELRDGTIGDYRNSMVFFNTPDGRMCYTEDEYEIETIEEGNVYWLNKDGSYDIAAFFDDGIYEIYFGVHLVSHCFAEASEEVIVSSIIENGVRTIVTHVPAYDIPELVLNGYHDEVVETIYTIDGDSGLVQNVLSTYIYTDGAREKAGWLEAYYGENDDAVPHEYVVKCKDMTNTRTVHYVMNAGTKEEKTFTFTIPKEANLYPDPLERHEYFTDAEYTIPYAYNEVPEGGHPDELTVYMRLMEAE